LVERWHQALVKPRESSLTTQNWLWAPPATTPTIDLGRVWRALLSGADREQAFRALEVVTLLALRGALRNGTVWIDHSLVFRSRERLFIPAERWEKERNSYYRRLSLPKRAESYLEPLIERAKAGVAAVAKAVEAGEQPVDDELHLTPLAADEEEPELVKLRAALDHRIGEAQLPDLLLQVDAKTRFSWIGQSARRTSRTASDAVTSTVRASSRRTYEPRARGCSQPNLVRKASVRRLVSDAQNSVFGKVDGSPRPSQISVNPCGAPG
jgi:hypothetical protein